MLIYRVAFNSVFGPILLSLCLSPFVFSFFFFFNDTATTEIYTLSLHDALPISNLCDGEGNTMRSRGLWTIMEQARSEEHTSELQSHSDLVCRLLLEKKKQNKHHIPRVTPSNKEHHPSETTTGTR